MSSPVVAPTPRRAADASGAVPASDLVPAYYWAGDGSALVHRLKGFDREVDGETYRRAYDADRLRWLRDAFGVNLVFLSYNWGLPPEIESADWSGFERAAARAHATGMRVAAYVQPSNAVAIGSYERADWYAVTPKGRRIPYYNGRYFTCLNHPAWRATVLDRVIGALRAGADAIFLDNCAFGGMPIPLSRDYTAFAGCFCAHCQASFRRWQAARGQEETGVPRLFRPLRDPVAREFSHWRAWTLTSFIREIKSLVLREKPEATLMTNTVGAVNVNTYHVFGVDLPEIAHVVDALFVENLQSPRAERGLLVQNAGTFKLLQSLKPGAPTLSISYERGIGVDGVPPADTFTRTMAEGYAAGGAPVVRAAEYIEDKCWTLLRPGSHDSAAAATLRIVDFVRRHRDAFGARESAAAVAILVPQGLAWRGDVFPERGADYLGVIQALVGAKVPFRVVTSANQAAGGSALIIPSGIREPAFEGTVLRYDDLGVRRKRRSPFEYFVAPLEPLLRVAGPRVVDGYYSRVHVRRFADRLDLLFRLAFKDQFEPLTMDAGVAALLRGLAPCAVESQAPVYVDLWKTTEGLYLHLVNYTRRPVEVRLRSRIGPPDAVHVPGADTSAPGTDRVVVQDYALLSWNTSGNAPPSAMAAR